MAEEKQKEEYGWELINYIGSRRVNWRTEADSAYTTLRSAFTGPEENALVQLQAALVNVENAIAALEEELGNE